MAAYKLAYTLLNNYLILYNYCRLRDAMFNLRLTLTSDRDFTCPVVLLEHGNMGLADVGIALLSYSQDEIYVIAYVLPVNGGHL